MTSYQNSTSHCTAFSFCENSFAPHYYMNYTVEGLRIAQLKYGNKINMTSSCEMILSKQAKVLRVEEKKKRKPLLTSIFVF